MEFEFHLSLFLQLKDMPSGLYVPSDIFVLLQHGSTDISFLLLLVLLYLIIYSFLQLQFSLFLRPPPSLLLGDVMINFPGLNSRSSHCFLLSSASVKKLPLVFLIYSQLIGFIFSEFQRLNVFAKHF